MDSHKLQEKYSHISRGSNHKNVGHSAQFELYVPTMWNHNEFLLTPYLM